MVQSTLRGLVSWLVKVVVLGSMTLCDDATFEKIKAYFMQRDFRWS